MAVFDGSFRGFQRIRKDLVNIKRLISDESIPLDHVTPSLFPLCLRVSISSIPHSRAPTNREQEIETETVVRPKWNVSPSEMSNSDWTRRMFPMAVTPRSSTRSFTSTSADRRIRWKSRIVAVVTTDVPKSISLVGSIPTWSIGVEVSLPPTTQRAWHPDLAMMAGVLRTRLDLCVRHSSTICGRSSSCNPKTDGAQPSTKGVEMDAIPQTPPRACLGGNGPLHYAGVEIWWRSAEARFHRGKLGGVLCINATFPGPVTRDGVGSIRCSSGRPIGIPVPRTRPHACRRGRRHRP